MIQSENSDNQMVAAAAKKQQNDNDFEELPMAFEPQEEEKKDAGVPVVDKSAVAINSIEDGDDGFEVVSYQEYQESLLSDPKKA